MCGRQLDRDYQLFFFSCPWHYDRHSSVSNFFKRRLGLKQFSNFAHIELLLCDHANVGSAELSFFQHLGKRMEVNIYTSNDTSRNCHRSSGKQNMDQLVLGQFAHRVGYTLSKWSFCDGCYHAFNDGEMGFRCLECSSFVCPGSDERMVRQIAITTNLRLQSGETHSSMSQTKPYTDNDLCLDCAKKPFLHSHHHFTLTICRH